MSIVGSLLGHVPKAILYVRKYDLNFFQRLLIETTEEELRKAMESANTALDQMETGFLAGAGCSS